MHVKMPIAGFCSGYSELEIFDMEPVDILQLFQVSSLFLESLKQYTVFCLKITVFREEGGERERERKEFQKTKKAKRG